MPPDAWVTNVLNLKQQNAEPEAFARQVTAGAAWKTLLAGVLLAVVGGLMASQGMIAVGLTGTIIALVGLYLIALGAWGLHRGVLGALTAITALALVALLTLPWMRTELWGTGPDANRGLVPRDVLPWLRDSWWGGLAVLGGIILLAVLISLIPRRRPKPNRAAKRPAAVPSKAEPGPPPPPADASGPTSAAGQAPAPAVTGPRPDADITSGGRL